jgi:hypothetical protein
MRHIFSAALLMLCVACSDQPTRENGSDDLITAVKKLSRKRISVFELDTMDLERLKRIDSSFFKAHLEGIRINHEPDRQLNFLNASWFFFDYCETQELFLFSIASFRAPDEPGEGFTDLFHFTVDKVSGKILVADLAGVTGGDETCNIETHLSYNKAGDELLVSENNSTETNLGNGYAAIREKKVTSIHFSRKSTSYTRKDFSVSYDTSWYAAH